MGENLRPETAVTQTRSLSVIPTTLSTPSLANSDFSSKPIRHTQILSPKKHRKKFSYDFQQLIKSFETGEFTFARRQQDEGGSTSSSQAEESERTRHSQKRKTVTFLTKTGEGESSPDFKERIKRIEVGEYRAVRGRSIPSPGEVPSDPLATPKKSFVTKEIQASFLRSEAKEAKAKLRLEDLRCA